MAREHKLQNEIRNDLAGECLLFRGNVGTGWTGDVTKLPGKRVIIDNARPFSTGLPTGFSDLFGGVAVTITPDMVGQQLLVFLALEVKPDGEYPTEEQRNFLRAVNDNGGRAGVVRSTADAMRVMRGDV